MLSASDIVKNTDLPTLACSAKAGLGSFLCNWQSFAGLALLTSATILAFIYILSVLFRNENLKNFVKIELSELFMTAVLIIILVTGIGAVATLEAGTFLPENDLPVGISASSNIYNVTESYFEQVGTDMGAWLEVNYILGVYVDSMASVTPYARPLGIGLVASPLAGLASPFKQLLYNMSVALSIAYIINYAQLYVFLFAIAGSLKYYIPLGIILRSFTPTRRIGGALIGLGISFLFVFPVLYSFDYMMFYSKDDSPMVTFRSFLDNSMSLNTGLFGKSKDASDYDPAIEPEKQGKVYDYFKKNQADNFIDLVTEPIGAIGRLISGVIGRFFTSLMVIPLATIGRAFALGFILPAFNTLLMIQATKYISKSIGEEVDISTLTRLV
jgi:hypothetical protein